MPKILQWLYPGRIWAFSQKQKAVYLTFDDGPIPEITPWVLGQLKKHKAQATFFCIGENVKKHPHIFNRILSEGHAVGNHTFHHLNGWKTATSKYIENTEKAQQQMGNSIFRNQQPTAARIDSELFFRPPYGKITSRQAKVLRKKGFKIVMWSIISYDYDGGVSPEKCLGNVTNHLVPGSIVVFHDSLKAEKNLRYVLPKVLEYISEKGWEARSLKEGKAT